MENWKPIEDYEGLYEVSDLGRVRNIKYDRFMTAVRVSHGYLAYRLHKQGKARSILAHRLVAAAFIPNPQNLPIVNHKDGIKQNNAVSNLEWCTQQENIAHAIREGLRSKRNQNTGGVEVYGAKLWASNLRELRENTGLTREELAELCCVRVDTIQRLESSGMYFKSVGLNVVCKLAWALKVSVDKLFDYDVAEAIRKEKAWHKR